MSIDLETDIMNIVVDSGSCRSYSMEAIAYAKEKKFKEADTALENANNEINKAHKKQTELIQNEINGDKIDINLIMVHAQDHLMTALLARDLAKEIVELYKKIEN